MFLFTEDQRRGSTPKRGPSILLRDLRPLDRRSGPREQRTPFNEIKSLGTKGIDVILLTLVTRQSVWTLRVCLNVQFSWTIQRVTIWLTRYQWLCPPQSLNWVLSKRWGKRSDCVRFKTTSFVVWIGTPLLSIKPIPLVLFRQRRNGLWVEGSEGTSITISTLGEDRSFYFFPSSDLTVSLEPSRKRLRWTRRTVFPFETTGRTLTFHCPYSWCSVEIPATSSRWKGKMKGVRIPGWVPW